MFPTAFFMVHPCDPTPTAIAHPRDKPPIFRFTWTRVSPGRVCTCAIIRVSPRGFSRNEPIMHIYTYTYIQNGLDGSATAKIFTRRPGFVVAVSLVSLLIRVDERNARVSLDESRGSKGGRRFDDTKERARGLRIRPWTNLDHRRSRIADRDQSKDQKRANAC